MARSRKKRAQQAAAPAPAPVPEVATGMGELLSRAGLSRVSAGDTKPKRPIQDPEPRTLPPPGPADPSRVPPAPGSLPPREPDAPQPREEAAGAFAPRSAGDLAAWNEAYRGVRPLRRPAERRSRSRVPARPPTGPTPEDARARARLGALVADDVRFRVERDGGYVRGLREGADESLWRRLSGRGFAPEASLDLHGMGRQAARKAVVDFVRSRHRSGLRYLLLIVGKGHHSQDGVGVLGEEVAAALTGDGAAPLVHAFSSAHPHHGGRGAIAVHLR